MSRLDKLIRDALQQHARALYEHGDPNLSPWPDDPDGSLLRLSAAITEVLDCCRDLDTVGPPHVQTALAALRVRLAQALELG